jgi:YesN/AraC family two-component response regulator
MAQGGKEHRMLFDLQRGRRRTAVKVVYACLAVLMGLSLFLVVGSLNIGELFSGNGGGSGSSELAKPYEEQAERLEVKLKKAPEDQKLLEGLTRARVTAGNSLLSSEPSEEDLTTALQQYQLASSAWAEYLDATDEPSAGTAQLVAPALLAMAERSRTYEQAQRNIEAASEAQKIVAEQRPTLNSYSTLALYTYFTGDFKAAETAQAKAAQLTREKFEREELDKQMEEVKKNAVKFQKSRKQAAAAEKAAAKSNKGNPESLQSPTNPLGGAFGTGTGLAE